MKVDQFIACALIAAIAISPVHAQSAARKAKPATTTTAAPLRFVVAPTGNEARYRVREQLAGFDLPNDAVGVTHEVTGVLIVNPGGGVQTDSSRIVVGLKTLKSDKDRRDGFVQRRVLETDKFPTVELVPTTFLGLDDASRVRVSDELRPRRRADSAWRVASDHMESHGAFRRGRCGGNGNHRVHVQGLRSRSTQGARCAERRRHDQARVRLPLHTGARRRVISRRHSLHRSLVRGLTSEIVDLGRMKLIKVAFVAAIASGCPPPQSTRWLRRRFHRSPAIRASAVCAPPYRRRAWCRGVRSSAEVLLCALHRVADQRYEVRLVARLDAGWEAALADQLSSGSAAGDRRVGSWIRGDARWRSAPAVHSLPARVWRSRASAGHSGKSGAHLRRRAHGRDGTRCRAPSQRRGAKPLRRHSVRRGRR